MRNAPIVDGVPNGLFFQNRAYPSRFHGGIWTRPVFSGNVIARPQDVLTPGYNLDREMPQPTLSGLGEVNSSWEVGNGVFKPGGYGGGVFDGDISGLGSIGRRRVKKGIAMRGLGDDAVDYPWRVKSDKTIALQSTINASLLGQSMCPITVDGKMGGATCGAIKFLGGSGSDFPDSCSAHASEFVAPKKNTGNCGASVSTSVAPSSPLPAPSSTFQAGMSSGTKRTLGFALGGLLAIGAVVLMRRHK